MRLRPKKKIEMREFTILQNTFFSPVRQLTAVQDQHSKRYRKAVE